MTDANIDDGLIAEVASRLDLREPNRAAIESVVMMTSQHFDVDDGDPPYRYPLGLLAFAQQFCWAEAIGR